MSLIRYWKNSFRLLIHTVKSEFHIAFLPWRNSLPYVVDNDIIIHLVGLYFIHMINLYFIRLIVLDNVEIPEVVA